MNHRFRGSMHPTIPARLVEINEACVTIGTSGCEIRGARHEPPNQADLRPPFEAVALRISMKRRAAGDR